MPTYSYPQHEGLDQAAKKGKIDQYTRSVKGSLGFLTRCINEIYSYDKMVSTSLNKSILDEPLRKAVKNLESQWDKYNEWIALAKDLDQENYAEWEGYLDKHFEKVTAAKLAAYKYLDVIATYLNPQAGEAPVAPAIQAKKEKVDIRSNLAPSHELSRESTPYQMRKWMKDFRTYYRASNLQLLELNAQRGYAFDFVSESLEKILEPLLEDNTPVFTDPTHPNRKSLMQFIEDKFLALYPLQSRRLSLFNSRHPENMLSSEYLLTLFATGELADVANFEMADIVLFIFFATLNNKPLLKDILKLPAEEKTYEGVMAYALNWESADLDAKASTSHQSSTNKTFKGKSKNSGNSNKPQASPNKPSNKPKQQSTPSGSSQKCKRCGRNHHHDNCSYPSSVTCNHCSKQGHIAPICRLKDADKKTNSSKKTTTEAKEAVSSATKYYHVSSRTRTSDPLPRALIEMSQNLSEPADFHALIDTGSSKSLIAKDVVDRFDFAISTKSYANDFLRNASGAAMDISGKIDLSIAFGDSNIRSEMLVSKDLKDELLLSYSDCLSLNLITIKGDLVNNVFCADSSESMTARIKLFELPKIEAVKLEQLKADYPNVLVDQANGYMKCPPMEIKLMGNPKPHRVCTTKQTPLHLQEAAAEKLKVLLKEAKIEKLPPNEPTEWCSRAFWVPKGDGRVRLVNDLSPLNRHILRPVHTFKPASDIVKSIDPKAKVFLALDMHDGYHQIKLTPESSALTTFLLPSGRYRYLVAPMGLSQSSDFFCSITDQAFSGLKGCIKLVDDLLLMGHSYEDLWQKFECVLQRCQEYNIALSALKIQVGPTVHFAGYLVSNRGIEPSPERTQAIREFKAPTDLTSLRSFLGLCNQLCSFSSQLSSVNEPLRALLKKDVKYMWLEDQEKAFLETKKLLTSDLMLKHYDPSLSTVLVTDGSRAGIGYYIYQIDPKNPERKNLITCGSRGLTGAEFRYSVSELELLGLLWACRKTKHYTLGAPCFTVHTDHRPLVGLFLKDITDVENPRLRRFREHLTPYTFKLEWVPGSKLHAADALSRYPVGIPENTEKEAEDEIEVQSEIQAGMRTMHESCNLISVDDDFQLLKLVRAASYDDNYKKVIAAILEGKILKNLPPDHPAHCFKEVFDELAVHDYGAKGQLLTVNNHRIVVPKDSQNWILDLLHRGHPGFTKTKLTAKAYYYWPQMNEQLKSLIQACSDCQTFLPSLPKEPEIKTFGKYPMDEISFDYFHYDSHNYLSVTDRYSGFKWCFRVPNMSTSSLIKELKGLFLHLGYPNRVRCDNQTTFQSQEFISFLEDHGIKMVTSSPYFPQSNGHAENGVKTCKHLLAKCKGNYTKFCVELSAYLNVKSPHFDNKSPFELFFNRASKPHFPILPASLDSDNSHFQPILKRGDNLAPPMLQTGRKNGHPLPPLLVGDEVIIQSPLTKKWSDKGSIDGIRPDGRSYSITLENGSAITRNRRFLRKLDGKNESLQIPNSRPLKNDHKTKSSPLKLDNFDDLPRKLRRSPRFLKSDHSQSDRPTVHSSNQTGKNVLKIFNRFEILQN